MTNNVYILTLAVTLLFTTVIMVALGQDDISHYYLIYVVETLVITEIFIRSSLTSRFSLTAVCIFLFGGFAAIVAVNVIKILSL